MPTTVSLPDGLPLLGTRYLAQNVPLLSRVPKAARLGWRDVTIDKDGPVVSIPPATAPTFSVTHPPP